MGKLLSEMRLTNTSILKTECPVRYRDLDPDQHARSKAVRRRKLSRSDLVPWHFADIDE